MPRNDSDASRALRAAAVVGLAVYAFALQFATPHLGSIDGYFHMRYSALLRDAGWRGFPLPFPWLPLTILSPDRYFDHHFLFHAWLALFAGGDLILGAKIAAAIGAALAFIAVYAVLLWFGIWRAHWWMLLCLSFAPGFQYRLEMPRVQSWSLACLLAALPLFLRERSVLLFALAWVFTWLYDAFPFLLAIGICAAAAWLRSHTPAGSLVFLADWDDFPLLYFHDTANTYSLGLDPSYLSERDALLFDDWRATVEGRAPHPAALMRDHFGAVAAFTDRQQSAFIAAMDRDPEAQRAFADDNGIIYLVRSTQEGTAP